MSPHSGLYGFMVLVTTGLHLWLQHAVPPGLLSPKGGTTNTLGKSGQRLRNLEYASFAEPKATISQK